MYSAKGVCVVVAAMVGAGCGGSDVPTTRIQQNPDYQRPGAMSAGSDQRGRCGGGQEREDCQTQAEGMCQRRRRIKTSIETTWTRAGSGG